MAEYGDQTVYQWLYGSTWWTYGAPYVLPEVGQTPGPGHVGDYKNIYFVMCSGKPVDYGYVYPNGGGPTSAYARNVAQTAAGDIPLPGVSIGVAPSAKGITGLTGWFWVAGMPTSGFFTASASALGATISVQARPTSFVWDFGDGAQFSTTSRGVAYPGPDGPAAIHHVYQVLDERPGYPLSLTFVMDVRYQVNGGAWTDLGLVQRTISVTYPVGEVVSSIVSRS